jgi:hypothetical protein
MSVYFNDHSIEANHARRSLRAGAVAVGARVLITFIQVLTFRLSAPSFSRGLRASSTMVSAITVLAPLLVGLGTPDPVVQRARITEKEISALFWISAAVGCSAAVLMAASGPLIARFYGEPRLTGDRAGLRAHICRERTVLPAQYTIATSNEIRGLSRRGDWREARVGRSRWQSTDLTTGLLC